MLATESVFTFSELARKLPRIDGKKIHISSLHRWCRKGVRGVKLEFRMLGGRMMTSVEAVDRFSAAVAEAEVGGASPGSGTATSRVPKRRRSRTEAQRRKAIEQAEAMLDAAGI